MRKKRCRNSLVDQDLIDVCSFVFVDYHSHLVWKILTGLKVKQTYVVFLYVQYANFKGVTEGGYYLLEAGGSPGRKAHRHLFDSPERVDLIKDKGEVSRQELY